MQAKKEKQGQGEAEIISDELFKKIVEKNLREDRKLLEELAKI